MRVGIGLPNTLPGVDGRLVLDWARRADRHPFTSLGVLDRIRYWSFDPFAVLAAAAGVTERVGLVSMVVIGPLRATVMLAKQAASVHALSGGRMTLGLAIGARQDDYRAAGVEHRTRGARFAEQLPDLLSCWQDLAMVPSAAEGGRPGLLVGGLTGQAHARMARYADGYVHGGGPPRAFAAAASRAAAAWADLRRPGRPALWGQGYFALGSEAAEPGAAYLRDYYAFTGPFADKVAAGNLTTPQAVKDFVRGYEEAGCDELVLFPTVGRPDQLDRLAEVLT